jgi:hypothetical protein
VQCGMPAQEQCVGTQCSKVADTGSAREYRRTSAARIAIRSRRSLLPFASTLRLSPALAMPLLCFRKILDELYYVLVPMW